MTENESREATKRLVTAAVRADERKATVERIREAAEQIYREDGKLWREELMDLLDAEAQR